MKQILLLTLCSLLLLPASAAKRKVHTIGDSTMAGYQPAATPKRGWGMYLQAFFNSDSVEVNNRGKSGASTRTFYETESLWPSVKQQMTAGDYLIIQFAHNDEKCKGEDVYVYNSDLRAQGMRDTITDMRGTDPNTTYKEYLRQFVHEAREMGVTPILMSPICRAYFKDGKIEDEGRHILSYEKDYVRSMQEVAEEMAVPFLDMTAASRELFEKGGKEYCMKMFFDCGDKTHTGKYGGMAIGELAYKLIQQSQELEQLRSWTAKPSAMEYDAYAQRIEETGQKAAFAAKGTAFSEQLHVANVRNMKKHKNGYIPSSGTWPAGEVDEVANRYIEYILSTENKKGIVVESITVPVFVKGGNGMNIHINYGFGETFSGVTTIYENTALKKNKAMLIKLEQPIMIPVGQTLSIRVLPWYDSNGKPQKGKYIDLADVKITGKKLK